MELEISNSKGEPLADRSVVVRRSEMTLEENKVYVIKTDRSGRLNVDLRVGNYAVAVLNEETVSRVGFEIARSKEECAHSATACITVSAQSPGRIIKLKLPPSSTGSNATVHELGHASSRGRSEARLAACGASGGAAEASQVQSASERL
jgi:hypothetical protein